VSCGACGEDLPAGAKFCMECGTPAQASCAGCGFALVPGAKFCMECGAQARQTAVAQMAPKAAGSTPEAVVAERRVTSVLFGDLVGFTSMSEARDPEEVRELLSRYFSESRKVIERYGGTVEKFIGDAVMAVWGVPLAHEDDAERAVRAGLDLVAAVQALGEQVGVSEMATRVGIVTGEVAVTLGAVGEGMVAGDAVNTAARVQVAAAPGQVWVDDATRSLTAAAVSYADAGEHQLKGKAEPMRLFAARAVVAALGGVQRVDGLEAPFTGRDRDLRLVKELFNAVIEDRRPRHVAVWGAAGVGKSRLGWEFEKYVDGIGAVTLWHRGRALSYGDGVAFWALAEMVRARLGIADGEPAAVQQQRLATALPDIVPDPNERERLAARLAVLLGLDTREDVTGSFSREDLFSSWTAFFERVSVGGACVTLVFEDMQHADSGLLDFIDRLLDSARFPLFVVTLSRPELNEVRPTFGTGRRSMPIHLEPLGDQAMGDLVDGLVDGLPASARDALTARADGIPLYAVETVRALIDRDAVIPRNGRYVLADDAGGKVDLTEFGAPTSLQALIAARLDALSPDERRAVGDASVHGMTFTGEALEATSPVEHLDAVLASLVRKEILTLHTDPMSPERGQYRFVQALVRTVAYDTLSRRDRKARHLAVASQIAAEQQVDELAGVLARHYLDAIDAAPSDEDADQLRAIALDLLERAAQRANVVGSPGEALRHYLVALDREPGTDAEARLREGAARSAGLVAMREEAFAHADRAKLLYEQAGRPIDAGRAVAITGWVLVDAGRLQEAIDMMSPYYDRLHSDPTASTAIAPLASELARAYSYQGQNSKGEDFAKVALQLAESRSDWAQIVEQLTRYATLWVMQGMPTGGMTLLAKAVDLAREHHLPYAMLRPLGNIASFNNGRNLQAAEAAAREGLAIIEEMGARDRYGSVQTNLDIGLWYSGGWDEVLSGGDLADSTDIQSVFLLQALRSMVRAARGTLDQPPRSDVAYEIADDPYVRASISIDQALKLTMQDRPGEAVDLAVVAVESSIDASGIDDDYVLYWPFAVEFALAAGQIERAHDLLAPVAEAPPGLVTPLVHAQHLRLRGMTALARGETDRADEDLTRAVEELRAFGAPYFLARSLLSLAGLREDTVVPIAPLLEEARAIFELLGATPWVEAVDKLAASVAV
jgi:class 3 adenylate cyclase/tetratricopeptide (TPR) repeat protein